MIFKINVLKRSNYTYYINNLFMSADSKQDTTFNGETIIGIDLGTTYSAVAVWKNSTVDIIANSIGERTTPSWVSFGETEKLVGAPAKFQVSSNPENTVFDAKRLIGRLFDDPEVQSDMKHWPFKVKRGPNNKPLICVKYKGEDKEYTAEEISAMVLMDLKHTAETYLGHPVKKAVITVPAYFNDAQRRATKDAGTIAGLDVVRIINEPTAAALAYGLNKQEGERNILVFDLGGGTFDVSLLNVADGVFEVKATKGNCHLGGEDFDNKMLTWCLNEFKKQYKHVDTQQLMTNKKVLSRIRTACERAKKTLSSSTSASIEVESLFEGNDFRTTLTRAKFEQLCNEDFSKCLTPVEEVIRDAKIPKSQITDVVLVGGSTRIPKIYNMLKEYCGKEPKRDINPDEAVAYGAAVQGAILSGNQDDKLKQVLLIDVTPLSLGIETAGGIMTKLIERNTSIPCNKEQIFSTYSDNQPAVTIKVYEGEREFVKFNNLLGTFDLTGIPPMPRGVPKIKVKFDLDANGILQVTATEESTKKSHNIVIKNDKNRFTAEQLNKMVNEAKEMAEEDKKLRERIEARNELENYLYNARNSTDNAEFKEKLGEDKCKELNELVTEGLHWIESNQEASKEEYNTKQKEYEEKIRPILMSAYPQQDPTQPPSSQGPEVEEVD